MVPLPRFAKECDRLFTIGERYRMEAIEERSAASHSHYFARLSDLWGSLPERLAPQFATIEHLRKHALIMTGFRDERSLVASSKAEALRLAAFIKPMDEYAIVSVSGSLVLAWTAKSQSYKAQGKKEFQRSKDAVLAYVEDLIGIAPAERAA